MTEHDDGRTQRWARALGRLAGEAELRLGGALRRVRRGERAPTIHAYRGYGEARKVYLSGRVVADPGVGRARADDPWYRNLAAVYRRVRSDEIGGARVRARFAGAEAEAVTDPEGYFHVWLEPRAALDPGRAWHAAELELLSPRPPRPTRVPAYVLIPPRSARFGVISDMDDTVIRSNTTEVLRMLRDVLFGNAHTRLPFDGVAAFYQALWEGGGGRGRPDRNPIFYVSSSPWNLYDVLIHFLEIHRIPVGPLELRDWGFGRRGSVPLAHRDHKRAAIDRILELYPDLQFILIGDSGQEDPEIYHEVVHDHPDRIHACYIRDVSSETERTDGIAALAEEVRRAGSALVLADDTAAAAEHAADHGWIHPLEAEEVVAEATREEAESEAAGEKRTAPTVVVEGHRR